MNILCVDPGGTTGLAWWRRETFRAWHLPLLDAQDNMAEWLDIEHWDLVVFESFHISARTLKVSERDSLDAIEFIGVGRYLCRLHGVPFETQTPAEAKQFATDAKLRAMHWWTKGLDHPRDATRHLLLALAKRRLIDLRQLVVQA